MKTQKTLKNVILTLALVTTFANAAMAVDVPAVPAVNDTVTVPAAPAAGAEAPATVRVIQRIMDESAANSDTYCVYEQRQFCNYYGCFYQWQYICYPW